MTSERWQQVNDLFQLAADRAPEERTTFLQTACQGDEGLRREVESLIASYERAENFIESPAFEVAPELLTKDGAAAMVGQSIGHYRIESLIGVGGMGEVYLATDINAGRQAALKLLPTHLIRDAERLKRFQQEARVVAGLNHPNIVTVYEVGEDNSTRYIASELVEGQTLRQRLAHGPIFVGESIDIAIQVAGALKAAHQAGIVHRDIKPENIMLRPDGYVKVLDFGIAKLAEQELPPAIAQEGAVKMVETNVGSILGTVRYMSPEQASGAPIDKRTDIWSLGVVLYEMAAGCAPFAGETPADVLTAILTTEPSPLSSHIVKPLVELQQIISKALQKNPDERYQNANEILEALKGLRRKLELAAELELSATKPAWLRSLGSPTAVTIAVLAVLLALALPFFRSRNSTPTSIPEKSIAVLPFENLSRDPDNAYFADGIQDEILTRLSKIADLKVISRTSTQHYKSAPANLPKIAKELGVAHILEGSVQKNSDGVRVNVQLIKAADDSHLWADTFDRKLTDIFSAESEVAKAIADQLGAKLTGQEKQIISAKPTDNPEAYDAYLRGLAYSLKTANSTANVLNAQKYLREAVQLDPKFALSWALLSFVEARGYGTVTLQPTDALREEARKAAETALSLQPNLGEAILAKGFYHYACLKHYDTAVRYFEQARQFLPNSSRIPESLAYVTRRQGKWDRSEMYFNEAERLDPRNVSLLTQHALSYKDCRRFPEALRKLEQILNITPDDVDTIVEKAAIAQAEGDLPRASALLASVQPAADDTNALETQTYQAILERRPAPIISQLKAVLAKPDAGLGFYKGGLRFWLGWAQDVTGDSVAAKESWQQARQELEPFLLEQPENHILLGDLALTAMSLGDKPAALDFTERAMAALPVEKDAVRGPATIEILARVAANVGEFDRAIAALERLLSIPYSGPLGPGAPLTPALLRLDPMFDPLRNDPRFTKIVEEAKEPVVSTVPAKSIAVLPFENLSRDPENAYFVEGIQDEILTRLSKIADLKVISRTSTQHYKSAPENLPEIAKQLGVAHVLEGSVQKSGDTVRVNVQLIKAADDSHVWADTFDRKLTDIFSVESEVAKGIAEQLQAKLTGQEKQVIAAKPTDNPEAYDAYLRGLAYSLKPANTTANALGAQKYLREAVRLDPKFARAWALLSSVDSVGYLTETLQPTVALREEARQAAETALSLRPDLGEALMAMGYYHYGCLKDYDAAIRCFEQARQILPNDSRIPEALAYVTRRRGQWERSETYFNEAERLDPHNANLLGQHADSLMTLRRLPEALRKFDEVLNITPDDVRTVAFKAGIAQAEGDLPRAAALLAPLHPRADDARTLETQVYQAILERRPASIIPRLEEILETPDPALGYFNSDLRYWLGWAQNLVGDHVAAQESWRRARSELELFLKDQPDNFNVLSDLALINMGLGDKAAALAFAERAIAANPIEKDATKGASGIETLARVCAQTGEPDRAIAALQKLLSIPAVTDTAAPFTAALLRLDPMFDPLRSDPRFEKLVQEAKEPVATNVPAKSIAVLPFENLSRDPDNAYFAEGIQDEILTRLSKIGDLKVISRTSTRQYKSATANVPDIAKQLGVAFVVEGSVQKSGDAVRVNVQLIKAANDSHVWADTFDRKLTDAFSVESEVAKAIADQLGAKLTGQEQQVIAAKPTDNPEAYDAYLRGLAYSLKPANTTANALGAQKYLREAVRLDPKFARAWALLSSVDSIGYLTKTLQPTLALREEARQAAETALSLRPDLGEALMANGYYHYGCLKDYDTAIRCFEQARQILPNDSRIPEALAYVTRRRGQWERSETYFNEAERLDPRNANLLTQHAVSLMRLRRFPEALRKLDEVLNITPDDVRTVAFKAGIAQAEGDLPRAAALLAPLHPNADDAGTLETQVYQAILERRPASIIPRLEEILEKPDPELGYFNSDLRFWLGWAQDLAGDHIAARKSWRQARSELEVFLKEQPDNFNVLTDLALTNMGLGDKGAALAFAERAIAANSIEKDATSGPSGIETLARVAAQMGEPDRAIAALQKLLSVPALTDTAAPFTRALLRLDPMFDPLRNDSRFQELVAPADGTLSAPPQIPQKSIAVLPFENRSSDPENAFFTDGVQDEILTDLARIADLKVISRTSVMQYKTGAKRNLRQIGNELGVAHVVEGSVQRVGNRVRVNAQLIDAHTDAHLWAQTYDRDLSDVFAIQTEIAKTIADQLQAKLSPSEKSAIELPPTTDVTAFNLYSHAKNLFLTAFSSTSARAELLQAADLLKQAVARDPLFFQAYCQLAFTEINLYGVLDPNPAYLAEAEAALRSAARLRPDAGETHLARARNLYWGYLDYDGALRELEIARQSLPGEDWIFSLKGYIERRQGRWEESIQDLKHATDLDPRNVLTLQQLALTYQQLRRYAEEKSTFERILAFEPHDPVTKSQYAFVALDSKADTRPLHEVTDSILQKNPAAVSSVADNWLLCALAERDPVAARKALTGLGENPASLGPIADVRFNHSFLEGVIARLAKDDAKAKAAFTAARAEQEKTVRAQPNYGPTLCVLGLIDAALGRKQEALREGRRAVELLPVEKDAVRGIAMVKFLAMIAAWVGENDLACEQLAIAIRNPSDLGYGQLKLMPFWDALRGDPRFEKLVASLAPKNQETTKTAAVSRNDDKIRSGD